MLIVGGNQSAGGFSVDNSVRFDKNSSQSLSRTCGSSASSYTLSLWVKNCEPKGGDTTAIYWNGSGAKLNWEFNDHAQIYWYDPLTRTTGYYRDVSAWYHLVWSVSSNTGTMYINGVAAPGLTSVSSIDSLNSSNQIYIGSDAGAYSPQNGYFSEVCFIDGTALNATDFGEFDSDSGIWKPIDVSGLTFGSNGFYLDFKDSSALGNDVSGNNNDLTANSFSSLNQSTDTCTNNVATTNPLDQKGGITFSDGNLSVASTSASWRSTRGTFGVTQGKWFYEIKPVNTGGSLLDMMVGWGDFEIAIPSEFSSSNPALTYTAGSGNKQLNGVNSSYGAAYTVNDIIGVAFDADNLTVTFYKNGVSQGSISTGWDSGITWAPSISLYGRYGNTKASFNFGSPPFSISSGKSDANGHGNFEYSVPSGYFALCTKNLAEFG